MASTTYTDFLPPAINAAWLNDTNRIVYDVLANAANAAAARTALGISATNTPFTPSGGISSNNVQSALLEILSDLAAITGAGLIGTKRSDLANSAASTLKVAQESAQVNLLADYLNGTVGNAATNTTALNNAISDLTSGGTIYIGKVIGDFPLNPITVGHNNITILLDKATTLRWQTLGVSTAAITINASSFALRGGALRGPSSAVYVAGENCIKMIGTSTSIRKAGLRIEDVEFYHFGDTAIFAKFTDFIEIEKCYFHDLSFAGGQFLSCDNGWLARNTIDGITPGDGFSNAYGFALTHDSTNYNLDPNAGTKLAANPFCRGWSVIGNEVANIPWEGLDCHGGYEVQIFFNRVYATRMGISLPGSSGAATPYAGYSNFCVGNLVDARHKNGQLSGRENTQYGINVNGGSTTNNLRIICQGNTVIYKGIKLNSSSGAIQALLCTNANISNNVIDLWNGNGIIASLSGGTIANNQFGPLAQSGDTGSCCILDDGPTTKKLNIVGNVLDPGASTTADIGFRQASGATVRPNLAGNDFGAASVSAFSLSASGFCVGTNVTPRVIDSSGASSISVEALKGANGLLDLTSNATYTISDITGSREGQILDVYNAGSGTATIDRSNAVLDGGTNKALTTGDILRLIRLGSTWKQIAYSANS